MHHPNAGNPDAPVAAFYRRVLECLDAHQIRYLIGGGYALEIFTPVRRPTKDIDLFVLPCDLHHVFEVTSQSGYRNELTEDHWLGKIFHGEDFIDVIFGSGNGLGQVDEGWFEHAVDAQVLGVPVKLCAPEEMIWHKAFVMARDRYDGADVAHLINTWGGGLDWARLLSLFHSHWRVLLSHLILFGYVYPGHRTLIPASVMDHLLGQLLQDSGPAPEDTANLCRGPFLSRTDYLQAIHQWGYQSLGVPLVPSAQPLK